MIKLSNTIACQLITLIVGSVLLSQAIIVFVFFYKTDQRLDDYENIYISEHITSVYEMMNKASVQKRQELFTMIGTPEMRFSVSDTPMATNKLMPSVITQHFTNHFKNVRVYESHQKITFKHRFLFWFSDDIAECLIGLPDVEQREECPYLIYSFELSDGQWLNMETESPPDEFVLLLPVLISVLVTVIGITLVVIFAVRRITSPLRRLSEAADQLGRGESIETLNTQGPQELSSTIRAFNVMHERLSRFVQDRTKMLAAISHDLRTPITSLRLRTEFVEDKELQAKMVNTLEDMQTMVEACLAFSQQDVLEEETKVIDLVETLEELAEDSSHISFSSTMPSYDYACRNVNIKRAIRNLLENAVKYGHKAHMSFEKSDNKISIIIQDQGDGIPDDKLEEIFEPFIRLDKARNTESGSVGLGLSITRTIIHKHGGTITAVNTNPGLKMIISLPSNLNE